jgi:serine protease Do
MLRKFLCLNLIIVTCGLIVSVLFAQSSSKSSTTLLIQLSRDLEALSERVNPAIVQILATGYVPGANSNTNLLSKQRSSGSGVILDPSGYIVTNAHVVEGARRIQVVLAKPVDSKLPGRSILKARGKMVGAQIVGIDSETDLAVIKIQESGLPFLTLGDSDNLRQGQLVLAFGSPLGLENSVTLGVVSALARQLRPEDPMIYIQTDAPINPGNSGGPLVDKSGTVVGINTFILTQSGGSEGIGFAAPSNIVKNVYEQIRATGRVRRGEIGVYAQTITPMLAEGLGLTQLFGVILGDVEPGSPAEKAGLKIGDLILNLEGKPMENGRQFEVNLYRQQIGDQVNLQVLRGSDTLNVNVFVAERQDDTNRFLEMVSPERNLISKFGILGLDLDDKIAGYLPGLRVLSGVVVASRVSNVYYYEQESFQPGDVIHAINNKPIQNLAELRTALEIFRPYDPIVVQVERQGQFRFISFELE